MTGPPVWAERLVSWALAPSQREYVLGDLAEEWAARVERDGPRTARRWYRSQAVRSVGPALWRRVVTWRAELSTGGPGAWIHDGRQAARVLRRRPGLLVTTVLTLGLGIGAATAIYTLVDAVLLRGLPYDHADRLVTIWNVYRSWEDHPVLGRFWDHVELSYPEYRRVREYSKTLEDAAAYATTTMAQTGQGPALERVVGVASSSLFPMLGVQPIVGRTFAPSEEGTGAPAVAVVSHEVWRTQLGGGPSAIGRTVTLDGRTFQVIGVLPRGFRLRSLSLFSGGAVRGAPSVWIPLGVAGTPTNDDSHAYEIVGRLAAGATPAAVQAEVAGLGAGDRDWPVRVASRRSEEIGDTATVLSQLLVAVALLMLIACGNVAALVIGELAGRTRELSARAALGAGKGRLTRQLVLESGGLGLVGAVAGFGLARVLVPALQRMVPPGVPVPEGLTPDLGVFAVTAGTGLLFGALFGLLPGLVARRVDLVAGLKGRWRTAGLAGRRAQRGVVAGQLALAVTLLVATGLLVRSLRSQLAVDPGFDTRGIVTAQLSLPEARYPGPGDAKAFIDRAVAELGAIPGVTAVTATTGLPFSGRGGSSSFDVVGREVRPDEKKPEANRRSVLPGFHRTLGIPLVRGRLLELADQAGPPVVVISRSMGRLYWPGEDPIGTRIRRDNVEWTVVGIVEDLLEKDLTADPDPTFYLPMGRAEDPRDVAFVLRTDRPAAPVADALRSTLAALDPELPARDLATLRALVERSTRVERFRAFLIALFAVSALILAAVGVFGVTARTVGLAAREVGVRMALGARRDRLVAMVVGREAASVGLGLVIGLLGAAGAATLLRRFLFGIPALDPVSFSVAAGAIAAVGLGAAWLAARRISRLQPSDVMRAE